MKWREEQNGGERREKEEDMKVKEGGQAGNDFLNFAKSGKIDIHKNQEFCYGGMDINIKVYRPGDTAQRAKLESHTYHRKTKPTQIFYVANRNCNDIDDITEICNVVQENLDIYYVLLNILEEIFICQLHDGKGIKLCYP
ncbi:Hypothetical predicted protein [Octopus vulgaris]|uniref:Uncharacterized protein n=1 Tax=Octopus vulgaris TaxID=6645 RepID=A0AA36AVB7_OCTVU|nr:Hypothetical predicted protein [Octopus vulgaris]